LNGKVALILGAGTANNMGQAIATRFAAEGAKVIVAGRNNDELARVAGLIGVAFKSCDITSEDDLDALVGFAFETFGTLDIAVNATGLNHVGSFLDVRPPADTWLMGFVESIYAAHLI
jgi:NAD(P)-dependent dehydrogenase (short-subunit alcohol dehydrogenase family)